MLSFSKNKKQTFECKIEIEGADYSKSRPRLVLSPANDNKHIFFEGKIEGQNCKIIIPEGLDIASTGDVVLEVLVDNTLFTPWKSTYEMAVESVKINEVVVKKNEGSVKVIEAKIDEQKPMVTVSIKEKKSFRFLKENVSPKSKQLVDSFIQSYKKMPMKDKNFLKEHISKNYKPSKKAEAWAKQIFKESYSRKVNGLRRVWGLIPKVVMYAFDEKK